MILEYSRMDEIMEFLIDLAPIAGLVIVILLATMTAISLIIYIIKIINEHKANKSDEQADEEPEDDIKESANEKLRNIFCSKKVIATIIIFGILAVSTCYFFSDKNDKEAVQLITVYNTEREMKYQVVSRSTDSISLKVPNGWWVHYLEINEGESYKITDIRGSDTNET